MKRFILKPLIFVHRWLGIALCLVFLLWFPSGIGMMYWGFPEVSAGDRLDRSPKLDPAKIMLSPTEAAEKVGVQPNPTQIRLNSFDGRPVYRIGGGGGRGGRGGGARIVYADTGEEQTDVSPEMVDRVAAAWTGQPVSAAKKESVEEADQWTVAGNFRTMRPLYKYSWPNGEQAYLNGATAEVVQYTTFWTRVAAHVSAIPHWVYYTPLRKHQPQWLNFMIYASLIGTIGAIMGIVVAVWMYSPKKKYRLAGDPTGVPYRGQKRWHWILGVVFGLATVTWTFSGMMSLGPFPLVDRLTGTARPRGNQQAQQAQATPETAPAEQAQAQPPAPTAAAPPPAATAPPTAQIPQASAPQTGNANEAQVQGRGGRGGQGRGGRGGGRGEGRGRGEGKGGGEGRRGGGGEGGRGGRGGRSGGGGRGGRGGEGQPTAPPAGPAPANQTAQNNQARPAGQRGGGGQQGLAGALRGRVRMTDFASVHPRELLAKVPDLDVREIEFTSYNGTPLVQAALPGGKSQLLSIDGKKVDGFDQQEIIDIVKRTLPEANALETKVIDQYDMYYLDRTRQRPLPVILVLTHDADNTRYYVDPKTARVVATYSHRNWVSRYLYNGLHSLNFPWLYNYRPLWDIVVIFFMLGGTALCVTSLVLAWRVLGRKLKHAQATDVLTPEAVSVGSR